MSTDVHDNRITVKDAIREMMNTKNISKRELSRVMGKTITYMGVITTRNTDYKCDTLLEIAEACGYDIVLRSDGAEDIILKRSDI